jgi:CBS domain containing-hemolysin-like protein
MQTFIFLLLTALWVKIATMREITQRTLPWHNLGSHRGQAALLRELLSVRRGIALLHWIYSIIMILVVAHYVSTPTFDVLPTVIWVFGLAVLGQLIVRQQIVQAKALNLLLVLQQKYHSVYKVTLEIYKIAEAVGQYFVPTHPVVRSKEELGRFIDHQYHAHQALSAAQKRQVERILQLEERAITEKIIPLKKALMIAADETVGPLLLSDLHDDGHRAFLVYEKQRNQPSGLLDQAVAVSVAGRKQALKVAALMSDQLVYLPENATLQQAMVTFIETNAPLSVIIDGEKQPVGVLYIADILRDLFEKS